MLDLIVAGGRVVTDDAVTLLDVGVRDGKIVLLGAPGAIEAEATRTFDAAGCYVLPGGIDAHVHFSFAVTDTMRSQSAAAGSRAAAYGGTTTFIDFAWQQGHKGLMTAIEDRQTAIAGQHPHIDWGLHAMLTGAFPFEVLEEIPEAIATGVASFKTFTTFAGESASGELFTDDGRIWGVMNQAARNGGAVMVHCEDNCLIDYHVRHLYREGREQGTNIHLARPNIAEEAAISRVLLLARRSGSPLYVVHVSAHESGELISGARGRGEPVVGEVLHNNLAFTSDAYAKPNGLCYHNYPTLKSQRDQDALWDGLRADLSTVASDDYTIPLEKKLSGQRIDNVPGGHNGVETRLAVLFSEGVSRGRISIRRFVELTAVAPAKMFGLYPRKGALVPGSDADIVVIDPDQEHRLKLEQLHSDCDYSIWDGWQCVGYPIATILRGDVLVDHGRWVGPQGGGQFIPATGITIP